MECGFFLDNHKEVHPSTVDYQADTVNSTLLSFVPRTTRDTSGITVGQNPPNDCISYDSPESSQSLSTSCEMACQHDFNYESGASDWIIPTLTSDDLVLLQTVPNRESSVVLPHSYPTFGTRFL